MDDTQILNMLFRRLEAALEALESKYGPRLYSTAYNILSVPQDAEEAVNDTYLAIWNAIPPERPNPLCAYVFRTGRNIALKQLRSLSAQKRCSRYDLSLEELSDCIPSHILEDTLDARTLGRAINAFLATLSQLHCALFVRRYWAGDPVAEIARDLGISPQAASVRLHRIRTQLKEYLYKEGIFL